MEHRKQFYLTALLTAAILLLGWIMAVESIVGKPNPGNRVMYYLALKKRALAEKTTSPKLVLIGGSNVLYGYSAETLSKELHITTLDCGVSAVWGPEYILWDAKRLLKRGDIVAFFPEFGQYAYEGTPNITMLEYVVARDQDYLNNIPLPLKLRLFFSYDNRALKRQMKDKSRKDETAETMQKSQARLNDYGDLMLLEEVTKEDLGKRGTICQDLFRPMPSKKFRGLVQDFKAWCDQNGILFMAGCPSLYGHSAYAAPIVDENFAKIRKMYEEEGIPFLGNPRNFFYEIQYMHNTRDHLNLDGRVIHTEKMEKLLQPYVSRWLLDQKVSAPNGGLGL